MVAQPKFTQEQVNDIVRDRLKKADAKFLGKYGLDNVEALDAIVQAYDEYEKKQKPEKDTIKNNRRERRWQ